MYFVEVNFFAALALWWCLLVVLDMANKWIEWMEDDYCQYSSKFPFGDWETDSLHCSCWSCGNRRKLGLVKKVEPVYAPCHKVIVEIEGHRYQLIEIGRL